MTKKNYEIPESKTRGTGIRASILAGSVSKVTFKGNDVPMQVRKTNVSTGSAD